VNPLWERDSSEDDGSNIDQDNYSDRDLRFQIDIQTMSQKEWNQLILSFASSHMQHRVVELQERRESGRGRERGQRGIDQRERERGRDSQEYRSRGGKRTHIVESCFKVDLIFSD
jgi:hypothetical protein